jgi:ATP-dependent exoDNAse (exonuclease V) alpha subunit
LSLSQWQQALAQPLLVGAGAGNTPLVHIGGRLYLRRYWQYEQDVRGAIERRLAMSSSLQAALPIAALRQTLDRFLRRLRLLRRGASDATTGRRSPARSPRAVASASSPAARVPARRRPWSACWRCCRRWR